MIAILNYDMGNVGSIQNILLKAGAQEVVITRDHTTISQADKLILPGVGSFDAGMDNLNKYGLAEVITEMALDKHKPVLGICLGMQLLGRKSEEGIKAGLGLIPFDSCRFSVQPPLKVPHMGWDYVNIVRRECRFVYGLEEEQRYYFVHSYHAVCDHEDNILMTCEYGYSFTAAVIKDSIIGVQFHPEKSHQFGLALMRKFVEA